MLTGGFVLSFTLLSLQFGMDLQGSSHYLDDWELVLSYK